VFHALSRRGAVANNDATRAIVANKGQLPASQMTNESNFNCKVSFDNQMTDTFYLVNLILSVINFIFVGELTGIAC
jgi:hypothetical protein